MGTNETQIIQDLKKGKQSVFEDIFNEYYKPLCLFGYRLCPNKEYIVEDCVQDVLFKFWENRKTITNIRSFLFTSLRNKIISELRHINITDDYSKNNKIKETEIPTYEDIIIEEEVKRLLIEALNSLPDQCRKIFKLLNSGASYKEIAEDLEVSVNTVKTQRARAIKLLKEKTGDLFYLLYFISDY